MRDRVGMGWRGELSVSILERLDAIDVIEVIAEDWMHASGESRRALRSLAAERPMVLHGVAMGLASTASADMRRIDRMARLVDSVRPEAWSEHLAFVRAGGHEIGHLAAPPRSRENADGAAENIRRASAIIGSVPALENIATLVAPPAQMDEGPWTRAIVEASGSAMLLDLHNLYANAMNFGAEPTALMRSMPLERVSTVHLSGGVWLRDVPGRPRLLDDHLHDVPDPVFALLEELAAIVPRPLTVILERDGRYPEFSSMLAELDRARAALAAGRRRATLAQAA